MKPLALLLAGIGAWLTANLAIAQVPSSSPRTAVEEAKLTASDGEANDEFGGSVAASGDTALVGAISDDDKGINAGAAYVYVRGGVNWTEQTKLTASDGGFSDLFGNSVSISSDTALVGAFLDDDNGTDSGSAYVFVRSGTIWTEEAKLTPSDGAAGDLFGFSVSLSGDTALVGAFHDDDNGTDSGSAYVFVRSGTTWSEQAKLKPSDGAASDLFGYSVSLSDNRAVGGAIWDDDNGSNAGSAYVFVRSATIWSEEAKLTASDPASNDNFGYSLSLTNDKALVGVPFDQDNGQASGSAYVFVRGGTHWTEQAKLSASDGAALDQFGGSVSLSDDTALVGARFDNGIGFDSGSAYVFARSGTAWPEEAKLTASDGAQFDEFGASVSQAGNTVLVGAPFDDDNGMESGSAYVYRLLPLPRTYCTAKLNSCLTLPVIGFAGTPSATAGAGFVVSVLNTRAKRAGLLIYSDAGAAMPPSSFQGGLLCLATPIRRSIAVVDVSGTPGLCDGSLSIDMNAFAVGALGGNPLASLTIAGTKIDCQFWGRDTIANGALLSDALGYSVGQ